MPVVGTPQPRDATAHPDADELEQLLAAAHRRLDERGVPR